MDHLASAQTTLREMAGKVELASLGGVERPRRVVRFARLLHRPGRVLADLWSAPPSAAIHADRLATYGGMAPAEAFNQEVGCCAWLGEHQLDSAPACSPGSGIGATLVR